MGRWGWWVIALSLVAGAPRVAVGGNEAGNGGDVVVCYQGETILSTKLLDFHEAEVMRPELVPDLGAPDASPSEKVKLALDRLSKLDAERAAAYQEEADAFFANTRFVKGVVLEDIPDSGYVPIGKDCRVEQIAIQKAPVFPEDRLYTINQDLWERLDNDHRAGLMLHEIVYGEAIKRGHKNSVKARYFTELIASAKIATLPASEYERLVALILGGAPLPGTVKFSAPDYRFDAVAEQPFRMDLKALLASVGSGNLKWNATGLPAWLVLDGAAGVLMGTPRRPDIGTHEFRLAVQDGDSGALTKVTIVVHRPPPGNLPPLWAQDPILFEVCAGEAFVTDLSGYVRDPDGDTLAFRMLSGPAWAAMGVTGALSLTPTQAHIGQSSFQVDVSDGVSSARATVHVTVKECR